MGGLLEEAGGESHLEQNVLDNIGIFRTQRHLVDKSDFG